jgi:hypothetical protein
MTATYLHTTATTTKPIQPAFARTRRAIIRLQARRDEWLRRELDAGHTVRAHRHEIGGDFSVQP